MRVGIVGGGQLARMMALAAAPLGLRVEVYDPAPDACSGTVAPAVQGEFDDLDLIHRFAAGCDVVTFDFENVSAAALAQLAADTPVRPNPKALALTQDRATEKALFAELGVPVGPYELVDAEASAATSAGLAALPYPAILKTRRLGYDGKGQIGVASAAELAPAHASLGNVPALLESRLSFRRELSLLSVRGLDGAMAFYPLVENRHRQGILSLSLAPALVSPDLQAAAQAHAQAVAEALDYVGVFAIEFFDMDGQLLANEMAPRVHNSGHWSLEGAVTSQFENHLRAICGLPLGSTAVRGCSLMFNWIGQLPARDRLLGLPGLHWHDYGKQPRAGRKVGHATLVADSPQAMIELLNANAHRFDDPHQFADAVDLLRAASR